MILILLEYPDTISVEVSAKEIVPFLVVGSAALSITIHVFGISIEKPSPVNGVVLRVVSVAAPQEVRRKRQARIIILFIKGGVKEYEDRCEY